MIPTLFVRRLHLPNLYTFLNSQAVTPTFPLQLSKSAQVQPLNLPYFFKRSACPACIPFTTVKLLHLFTTAPAQSYTCLPIIPTLLVGKLHIKTLYLFQLSRYCTYFTKAPVQ